MHRWGDRDRGVRVRAKMWHRGHLCSAGLGQQLPGVLEEVRGHRGTLGSLGTVGCPGSVGAGEGAEQCGDPRDLLAPVLGTLAPCVTSTDALLADVLRASLDRTWL